MKLPSPLFDAVQHYMPAHGDWHIARLPELSVDPPDRSRWERARRKFPWVTPLDQRGAGREFLAFHRTMIREFRWIAAHKGINPDEYLSWPKLPGWVCRYFDAEFLRESNRRIREMLHHASDDALGRYIETHRYDRSYGAGIHDRAHGHIAAHEFAVFPNHPDHNHAAMDQPDKAHLNEHFWGLHAWIDELYNAWQVIHGEPESRSATQPAHDHTRMSPDDADDPLTPGLRSVFRGLFGGM